MSSSNNDYRDVRGRQIFITRIGYDFYTIYKRDIHLSQHKIITRHETDTFTTITSYINRLYPMFTPPFRCLFTLGTSYPKYLKSLVKRLLDVYYGCKRCLRFTLERLTSLFETIKYIRDIKIDRISPDFNVYIS